MSSTRLRYQLEIERRNESGFERLYVIHESLNPIAERVDSWRIHIPAAQRKAWIVRKRRTAYLSTEPGYICKHQDGRSGQKQTIALGKIEKTALSSINNAEYPTAYAARQEMLSWHLLQFNPAELRAPASIYAPTDLLPDGSNLAAVLYRMSRADEFALTDVSRDMANLVPGIKKIMVTSSTEREEFLIEAKTTDETTFSSRILSDGTLRVLALAALRHDSSHKGLLCLEEPENGVDPKRLPEMIEVLKSLATDFANDPPVSPRQMLINTHSPALLAYLEVETCLFVHIPTGQPRATCINPVLRQLFPADSPDEPQRKYTIHEVMQYLNPAPLDAGV